VSGFHVQPAATGFGDGPRFEAGVHTVSLARIEEIDLGDDDDGNALGTAHDVYLQFVDGPHAGDEFRDRLQDGRIGTDKKAVAARRIAAQKLRSYINATGFADPAALKNARGVAFRIRLRAREYQGKQYVDVAEYLPLTSSVTGERDAFGETPPF
jgi:hypothetical protein